jgi:cellulose synthase operon protein C
MSGPREPHDPINGRTDPKLGDLDHLDKPRAPFEPNDGLPRMKAEPGQRHGAPSGHNRNKNKHNKRSGWLLPLALVVVVLVVAGLWLNQSRLRGLVPRTDFDDVLHRAQTALQQGHLDGTDGTSARELFEAARALEPDNDAARQGLNDVGRAEIARADAALQAGHIDEAEQALTNARELLGGGSDVDRLTQAIAKAQVATGQTATLINQAQQALSDGKLDGPEGAAALYQKVLAADPDNAVARHGMDQVGDATAAQIQKALDANDLVTASTGIDHLSAWLPNYAQLPTLRASLAGQQAQASTALNDAINQGNDALRAGRIAGDGDDTALAHFKAALAIDPNNAQAKAGLGQVAEALIVQANAAMDSSDTAHARQLLDQAASLAPGSADLIAARARLGQPLGGNPPVADNIPPGGNVPGGSAQPVRKPVENADQDDNAPAPAPAELTPQQQQQVANMVQRARAAAQRGDIMSPPGDCAYDLYRGALSIDGNNPSALSGLQSLPGMVQQQFGQALNTGNLNKAGNLYDALSNLSPGDTGLLQERQRLVDAWLDQAEQQLDSGDRNNAALSLEQGRRLAPNDQRVQQLTVRMQGGG